LFLGALLATAACSSSPDLSRAIVGRDAGGSDGPTDALDAGAINCPTSSGPIDPTAMIDDMESGGDPDIPMTAGRSGSWWAGGDSVSPSATITPNGNAPAVAIPNGGRCGSLHAMRVSGQGFTSWAVLSVSMRWGADGDGGMGLLPYDVHSRNGVTFWARIGDTSAPDVRFAVSDKYSRPEGGICDVTVTNGATACYDTLGIDLPKLGTSWQQYQIPFEGLTQRNFGLPRSSVDTTAIYTIEFQFNVGEIFDFWVDDIAFY
jgi:hypothetical protein